MFMTALIRTFATAAWVLFATGCGEDDESSPIAARSADASAAVQAATGAAKLDDGQIMAIFQQVNGFDVSTAGVAVERASSPDVKQLAEMVKADHEGVLMSAAQLATQLALKLDLPPERAKAQADQTAVEAQLRSLSGAELDQAYCEHEIGFHTAAIDAVTNVLAPAAGSELRKFMTDLLPAFEHHLSETKRVAALVGAKID
jgi:putative membrane protein